MCDARWLQYRSEVQGWVSGWNLPYFGLWECTSHHLLVVCDELCRYVPNRTSLLGLTDLCFGRRIIQEVRHERSDPPLVRTRQRRWNPDLPIQRCTQLLPWYVLHPPIARNLPLTNYAGKISLLGLFITMIFEVLALRWVNIRQNKQKAITLAELIDSNGWTEEDVKRESDRAAVSTVVVCP